MRYIPIYGHQREGTKRPVTPKYDLTPEEIAFYYQRARSQQWKLYPLPLRNIPLPTQYEKPGLLIESVQPPLNIWPTQLYTTEVVDEYLYNKEWGQTTYDKDDDRVLLVNMLRAVRHWALNPISAETLLHTALWNFVPPQFYLMYFLDLEKRTHGLSQPLFSPDGLPSNLMNFWLNIHLEQNQNYDQEWFITRELR